MLYGFVLYFLLAFLLAIISTKNIIVSVLAMVAILYQFFGYGLGFFKSTIAIGVLKKEPESHFPNLFFKS